VGSPSRKKLPSSTQIVAPLDSSTDWLAADQLVKEAVDILCAVKDPTSAAEVESTFAEGSTKLNEG
jgi:hypothetical protein